MLSKDVISWQNWAESPAVGKDTQNRRKHVLELWAKANDCTTEVEGQQVGNPQALIDAMVLDKVTPYTATNKFLNYLRDQELAPSTVSLYRSMLGGEGDAKSGAGFFLSVLGEENFSIYKFNRLCPSGDNYTQVGKKPPTLEELRHILRNLANPRDKALLGLLSVSGFRLTEAITRKMSEIQRKDGYAVIDLQAKATKKRYARRVFLTKEVVEWIDAYHTGLQVKGAETWIFPGESSGHIAKNTAYEAIKVLFKRAGLADTEDKIYSPHSMRTFAIGAMRKAGLQEGMIDAIVGHVTRTKKVYDDFDVIEEKWVETCKDALEWLRPLEVVKVPDPKQEAKIKELENTLAELTTKQTTLNAQQDRLLKLLEFLRTIGTDPEAIKHFLKMLPIAQAQIEAQAQLEDKSTEGKTETGVGA